MNRRVFVQGVMACLAAVAICGVPSGWGAPWDNDPGVVWESDGLDDYVGPVARNWSTWFEGTGDREWNWLPGETYWGQEVKKSNVRVGIYRQNRGFISGDRYRIKVRAKLNAGFGANPSAAIGIHPTGGTDPSGVVYGPTVQLTQVGQWVDVTYEFIASNWTATIFLKADFTGVYDGSVIFDNVSLEATYLPGQPTRTPKPWMPIGAPPAQPAYIYGMHDAGAEHLFNQQNRKGWVIHAIGIGDDPNNMTGQRFSEWVDGHGVIARISYDFGYTLPHPDRFDEFAQRCANFVANSVGCGIWSIANEPGLETAGGVPITPAIYADAYIQCRNAIKAVRPDAIVITCGFVQGSFDFFEDTLQLLEGQCDGIAIHSYTNANWWNEANFNLYQQHMALVPQSMRSLPVYMTEAGNGATGPYPDQNNGFIYQMFTNIHNWNQNPAHQPIRSVHFYRWRNWDQWGIETKQGMIDDFLDAMVPERYWRDPSLDTPTPTPPGMPTATPTTPGANTPTPTNTPQPPSSTPVVSEPGFEGGLGNWQMWAGSGSNGDPIERDYLGGGAYEGVWALGVKGIGSGGKGAYQYISDGWVTGRNYEISAWCKNTSGTNINYSVGYRLGNTGNGGESATYGSVVAHPGSWTKATVQVPYSGSQGVTIYLRAVNDGHSERAGFDLVGITDLGGGGPQPTATNTPAGPANTPTPTPGSGYLAAEDFNTMPAWDSTWNATWGSAAAWSIQSGGQSGNYLQATRSSGGSSVNVEVYSVPASTDITVSIWMRCPSMSTYWMETACRLGSHSAQDFDDNPGSWTMIKKFDAYGGQNGNSNTWTKYSVNLNTGSSTQISVGFKLGSSGSGTSPVGWDTLRIEEEQLLGDTGGWSGWLIGMGDVYRAKLDRS